MHPCPFRYVAGAVIAVFLVAHAPLLAAQVSLDVGPQSVQNTRLSVSGQVSANVPEATSADRNNAETELRVLVEYIEPGGTFRVLPGAIWFGHGPVRQGQALLSADEQNGVKAHSQQIWSKKLQTPGAPAPSMPVSAQFQGTVDIGNAARYRVVAELSQKWTDANGDPHWEFEYATSASDVAITAPRGGGTAGTQTPPAGPPASTSTGVSVSEWAALVRQYYASGGQQPAADSAELTRARAMLATTTITAQGQQQTIGQIIQALHQNMTGSGTHGIPAAIGVSDSIYNTQIAPMSDTMIRDLVQMHVKRIAGASGPK